MPRDLARDLAAARVQPAVEPLPVRRAVLDLNGTSTPAILMTSPSRVTWAVRLPERAELHATAAIVPDTDPARAAGVTVRIGVSDDRTYDELARVTLLPPAPGSRAAWHPVVIDLTPYSGRKWSLFYRPSRVTWQVIVNADATPGGTVAIGSLDVRPYGGLRRR